MERCRRGGLNAAACALWMAPGLLSASDPHARLEEGFATRVRPILNANCFTCHNSEKPKRGLDLTRLETLLRGGRSGPPVVPGKPAESLLVRVLGPGHDPHMPPKKQIELSEVQAIARWIEGLPAGFNAGSLARKEAHWAFRPRARPEVPPVKRADWTRTAIDRFILARLEEEGLSPSEEAARSDLIRRAALDLTGLPPAPEEVDAFLLDEAPGAFERVVDRLLESPRYGERWGRHWLDLARFAESEGFKSDETRPNAWRWRDYVIRSLNEDKPYDRFIREQIAGDEIWPEDADARLATAFNRHYPDESNARDLYQRRQEILNDITDTVGSVFTALTFGCARCHDHKYDPISQADYYRLQAFFAGVRAVDDVPLAPEEAARRHREREAVWKEKTRSVRGAMEAIEEKKRKQIADDNFEKFPPELQAAILKPEKERTPLDWQMCWKAKPYLQPDRATLVAALGGEDKKRWQALKVELDRFRDLDPGELPVGSAVADGGREAPKTFILAGGSHLAPREEVEPGFPAALDPRPPRIERPRAIDSTGRRTALADWLASPGNPITPRVMANRVWHYHFGRGIAGTPSDFGALGEPPSHRDLLDWLACELVENGWSLKRLHRLIMTSSVYRQSSRHRAEAARADPENRLLWRFPRERLEAEAIRDSALFAAGLLDLTMGGPSVFPDLPGGMDAGYQRWAASRDPRERNRRSVYIFVRRNARYPLLEAFDFPDTHESCARRHLTITAPQALLLLNSRTSIEWAEGFAGRLLRELVGGGREAWIGRGYRIAYSRSPDRRERETALGFFERHRAIVAERRAAGEKLARPLGAPDGFDPVEGAVLVDFCHMLLNSNEFLDRP